jgi:hypothetical protein
MKLNSATLGTLGIVGVLFMTNPAPDLYAEAIASEMLSQAPDAVCSQLEALRTEQTTSLIEPLVTICKSTGGYGAFLLHSKVKDFVKSQTTRQNLIVCSVYTTNLPGKTVKAIGILNNFVPYPE